MVKHTSFRSSFSRMFILSMLAVYLLFSVGVMKATHFCMGRAANVSFFTTEAKKCACSIFATEKDTCCDDHQDLLKIEDDQTPFSAYHLSVPHLYILEDLYTEQLIASVISRSSTRAEDQTDASPPPISIFKINCSFVFYDDAHTLS